MLSSSPTTKPGFWSTKNLHRHRRGNSSSRSIASPISHCIFSDWRYQGGLTKGPARCRQVLKAPEYPLDATGTMPVAPRTMGRSRLLDFKNGLDLDRDIS